jgi:hypothetical protein
MIYPSIRIEGAILAPEILERLEEAPGQRVAESVNRWPNRSRKF